MTIFVDASALVSIVMREADATRLANRLADDPERLWSPMSCWETVSALRHSHRQPLETARERVQAGAAALTLRLVAVGEPELDLALDAYHRYGKGRHKAGLNMGDCFAYACAKAHQARLLYKGDDFAQTDLA